MNYYAKAENHFIFFLPVPSKLVDHKLDEAHGKKVVVKPHVTTVVQPTKATPLIHDSVAHHPRISYQKIDFPIGNPSPTSPIILSANLAADPSFESEAQIAAEQNKPKETAGAVRSLTRKAAVRSSVQGAPHNLHQKSSTSKLSDNFREGSKKDNVESERPDWNQVYSNAIRVYYEHGQRAAVAKKK